MNIHTFLLPASLTIGNIYLIYKIEYNKGTRRVFFRPDVNGIEKFHLKSYINFVLSPLNFTKPNIMLWFWKYKNLDLNIPLYNLSFITLYYLLYTYY